FHRRPLWEGRTHIQSFLDLSDPDDVTEGRARALTALTWLAAFQGDSEVAVHAGEEAVDTWRALGDRAHMPDAFLSLGTAIAIDGHLDRAIAIMRQAADMAREVGDLHSLARALNNLGVIVDDDEALLLLEEGLRVARETGSPGTIALALSNLAAAVSRMSDDIEKSREMERESLKIYHRMNTAWGITMALDGQASTAMALGQPDRAARLAGASAALRDRIGVSIQPIAVDDYHRLMSDLRAALKDDFEATWAAGARMSIDEAVQLALERDDVSQPKPVPASTILSKREIDVLKLLAEGRSNQEIAMTLFISPHTAAHHVTSILNKLGVDSRTAAATWAVKQGVV
nr:response regulator transcription factor [Chloroflexia bacterium]